MTLVLLVGGARSGKSAFAERLAAREPGPVLYVATARIGDAAMAARVAAHRARRPTHWRTVEEPLEPARAIRGAGRGAGAVLLECVGMLVANVLLDTADDAVAATRLERLGDELLAVARERAAPLIAVTAEVGLGLLPLTPLGRRHVDALGNMNQRLAAAAARTYLVVAGLAVDLRALALAGDPP